MNKCTILAIASMMFWAISSYAGSLTPPPGPVMPTRPQAEPRIPVQDLSSNGSALYVIGQPGSYYLIDNIVGVSGMNGIEITTNGVTLDLNGFALIGVSGSLKGVTTPTSSGLIGITVKNGAVRGWGDIGVNILGEGHIQKLTVSECGNHGVFAQTRSIISQCSARNNGGTGIAGSHDSVVVDCVASQNAVGISMNSTSIIRSCIAHQNTGAGITLLKGGVVSGVGSVIDCTSIQNGGVGISVETGGLVSTCSAIDNGGGGIDAPDSLVRGNVARGNTGFNIQGVGATLDSNHAP